MKTLVADFETTTYEDIERTEVWAAGIAEVFTDHVDVYHSIDEFLLHIFKLNCNCMIYFHNLKFDGSFILDYVLNELKWEQAYIGTIEDADARFLSNKDMFNKSVKYIISDMGRWYSITLKYKNKIIEFRDSLKLLPFSLREISNSFKTKYKKLDMEYKGKRYAGCEITDKEMRYIKNDVLVLKEAIEFMIEEGHTKMTIGACCLSEYKKIIGKDDFEIFFPDQRKFMSSFSDETAEEFVRMSYKGGWCYLNPRYSMIKTKPGYTLDVNSLYSSVMHPKSGNPYPTGAPTFWSGNVIPEIAKRDNIYYFVRVRCRFKIKKRKLPFIQIKHSFYYKGNECLKTSDILNPKTGKYEEYSVIDGVKTHNLVELTLTQTDYKLFLEHYDVEHFEIIGGCYYSAHYDLFGEYIDTYMKIKARSIGAIRTLAKLYLNNLYGKLASSENSSFKVAIPQDEKLKFASIPATERDPVYIPCGSAITSYAREFTIRAAQRNYNSFVYSDTDSLHLLGRPEQAKGVTLHDSDLLCWKKENEWDYGWFVRQKTYIEVKDNDYVFKCAGMPIRSKQLFLQSISPESTLDGETVDILPKTLQEEEFIEEKREITDFVYGITIPGKLLAKRIPGGIVLEDNQYKLRKN